MTEFFSKQNNAVSQLKADRCVNDVVGRRTKVDAPTGLPSRFGHGFGQRHDVVPCLGLDLAHAFFSDIIRICDGCDRIVVLFRNTTQLPVSPNQGALNLKLTFMASKFGPDVLEILATVAVIEWTEGHVLRRATRFFNLATEHPEAAQAASGAGDSPTSTGAMTSRIKKMASMDEAMNETPTHDDMLYHIIATPMREP